MLLPRLALAFASFLGAAVSAARPSLGRSARWICYYGRALPERIYASLDLAILDPDGFVEPVSAASRPIKIAYLSVGEVNVSRWYWPKVQGKPFVLKPNPNWPDSRFVDMRADAWRGLLLREVIPGILKKGYQGLFLDNMDMASYLEDQDPKKFKGSTASLLALAREIRRRHPGVFLLSNNALGLLDALGPVIDGAVVEDLYISYDFKTQEYSRKPAQAYEPKEAALGAFAKKHGRPVFILIHAPSSAAPAAAWAWDRALSRGFLPYAAPISLDRVGRVGQP